MIVKKVVKRERERERERERDRERERERILNRKIYKLCKKYLISH
jgi:hypothetical protein